MANRTTLRVVARGRAGRYTLGGLGQRCGERIANYDFDRRATVRRVVRLVLQSLKDTCVLCPFVQQHRRCHAQ